MSPVLSSSHELQHLFRHLVLLEMISFENIFKNSRIEVCNTVEIILVQNFAHLLPKRLADSLSKNIDIPLFFS